MYARIRRYKMASGSVDELVRQIKKNFMPVISKMPGFVAYYVLDEGDGVVASISVFKSQARAEKSNKIAADWVKKDLASLLPTLPEITAGKVIVHKAA